jgi:aminoglycoside phosphotransferase (APT) family kinase protein
LGAWLERTITDRFTQRGLAVSAIHRTPFPHIGSYDCERVTVEIDGHEGIELFLKDYAHSRQSKDQPLQRRIRELGVYSELLDGAGLDTPECYGSISDAEHDRFWMLLELVDGEVVEEVDSRNGTPAVEWLARMQAHFLKRTEDLERCGFLQDHGEAHFLRKAADARRDVAQLAPASADRLAPVLELYEQSVSVMVGQQASLVHGGYIPWHIFIDRARDPARVAVVDWELAARGSPLYDVATFIDDAAPALQTELVRVYRRAAQQHGVPLPEDHELRVTIAYCRLHRVIDWLSRSAEKGRSEKKITSLVKLAERRHDELAAEL